VDVHADESNKRAVIANYLLDSIQVVDLEKGEVAKTIFLGGPGEISLARQGETIFYDARRSHHQWFSCHTCHTDGHTCVRLFDTLNDESYGNPKMVTTLRNITRTGPYTWHGWQDKLEDAIVKSFTETMFGPKPTPEEVKAFYAYLETLEHPPAPTPSNDSHRSAIERGRALFAGKANCNHCHLGEEYTSELNRKVGVETDYSPFDLWNPPSLRGLRDRGPYMHDGRAANLDALLRVHHAPEKLGGKELTPEERKDLIEFLLSL
jgi:cytochrome c peroxidase